MSKRTFQHTISFGAFVAGQRKTRGLGTQGELAEKLTDLVGETLGLFGEVKIQHVQKLETEKNLEGLIMFFLYLKFLEIENIKVDDILNNELYRLK